MVLKRQYLNNISFTSNCMIPKLFQMATVVIALICISLALLFSGCDSKGTTKDVVNAHITRNSLDNMRIALELYKDEYGEYPLTLDELLMRKGITERSIIEDAWGRTYHYIKIEDTYRLFSKGRDGKPFTSDDIHPR
jgi:hypothetical protein